MHSSLLSVYGRDFRGTKGNCGSSATPSSLLAQSNVLERGIQALLSNPAITPLLRDRFRRRHNIPIVGPTRNYRTEFPQIIPQLVACRKSLAWPCDSAHSRLACLERCGRIAVSCPPLGRPGSSARAKMRPSIACGGTGIVLAPERTCAAFVARRCYARSLSCRRTNASILRCP